jgi:hypothetical protein
MNFKNLFFLILVCIFPLSCLPVFSAEFEFQYYSYQEDRGSFYFALDKKTGQAYIMPDAGDDKGMWKKYGVAIDAAGKGNFAFYVYCDTDGSCYFAMDRTTGQVYTMWNVGDSKGLWKKYGGVIDAGGKGNFELQVNYSFDGTDYLAMDKRTGQAYSMWNVGDNKGIWKQFGVPITK